MRNLFLFIFVLSSVFSYGQIEANRTAYDFGELYPNAQTYIDIEFTNHTTDKHFLLNVQKPRDVYYIFSSKVLLPDSSITIRLKINEGKKGKFNHDVDIYFSDRDQPITIQLKGNVKEVSQNPLTACPDFNSSPPSGVQRYNFALTIKVVDSLTREPIHRAKVALIHNNKQVGYFTTNRDGIIRKEVPIGLYLLATQKSNYSNNFKESYVNFQQNYILIQLQQPSEEPVYEEEVYAEEPQIEEDEESIIEIEITETPPIQEIPEETTPILEENSEMVETPNYNDTTDLKDLTDSLFDVNHFKLNNITFILDVSSSMNAVGKLELLKLSMTELVDILRDDDLITILKYSSSVDVVVESLSGKEKEEIISGVAGLTTSSSTAGGDAIEEAYRMNKQNYSDKRNNIVIMITDGAFNKGSNTYLETIGSHYEKQGIIFSVVGIKTSKYITSHMENVVSKGGGDFIEVRSVEDAETKIISEIKRTSFRGR